MNRTLIGTKVLIKISDPWDLGESLNWNALNAKIECTSSDDCPKSIILRLNKSFIYKNINCEYLIATARYENDNLGQLFSGKCVFCGLTRIAPEKAKSNHPFDLSKWRGGLALLAELEIVHN